MIKAVDLFAGAGGASTGLCLAAEKLGEGLNLTAINHWPAAVETHARNHPQAVHLCQNVESVDPREVVPGGKLDLLIAGPECTFFSMARGGKPINDQRRSSPWLIFRWLELLQVDRVLVENVPEMRAWGPLGANNKPLKSKRGVIYKQWIETFERYGYRVEERLINSADYGEATTRTRLFVQAARGRRSCVWPSPTHGNDQEQAGLFGKRQPWRAAKEIINWQNKGTSIFNRKRALSPNTVRRIREGLTRFGGDAFVLSQASGGAPRHVDQPIPTMATDGAHALVEPFLVPMYGERPGQTPRTHSINEPVPTIPATGGGKFGLVEPFTIPYCSNGGKLARKVSEPLGTITTKDRIALVEPFIITPGGANLKNGRSVKEPLPTVTCSDRFALVKPEHGDILFRMLTPAELAAAMGFPEDYVFEGTKTDAVKMIGNAWSVRVAEALCFELLQAIRPEPKKERRCA